ALFSLASVSWSGLTLTSPTPSSSSGSPVHFVASATSTRPITAMHIYVDGLSVYANLTNKLDTFVPLAAGSHAVVVKAWDSGGTVYKKPLTVTVGSSTPPVITGNVIDHIEEAPWLTCGACGNNGGTGSTAPYFDTRAIASPSEDGNATKFTLAA